MNFEKFTQNAQSAVMDCQNIGVQEGHQQLDGEHLHLALMLQQDGLIPKLIGLMGVKTGEIVGELEGEIEKLPKVQGGNDNMYSTRRLNQLLINAEKLASDFKDEFVSVEHIYMA
ncbi:MAG: Clp protease N-terminal domain-containing protein, partial [Eubacteriales bacterium]|nr:Clp protease N-terminal domain-containing protein [Eubacteriales bacterium]